MYLGESVENYAEDAQARDTQPSSLKALLEKLSPDNRPRSLTLGKIKHFDALRSEVEEDPSGLWAWRTASQKISLFPGNYRVYFYLTTGGRLTLPDGAEFIKFTYVP
jgi:hypothetical protein